MKTHGTAKTTHPELQLERACGILAHYHEEHTDDKLTRFKSPRADGTDIYVVSDPEWRQLLEDFCVSQFPEVT